MSEVETATLDGLDGPLGSVNPVLVDKEARDDADAPFSIERERDRATELHYQQMVAERVATAKRQTADREPADNSDGSADDEDDFADFASLRVILPATPRSAGGNLTHATSAASPSLSPAAAVPGTRPQTLWLQDSSPGNTVVDTEVNSSDGADSDGGGGVSSSSSSSDGFRIGEESAAAEAARIGNRCDDRCDDRCVGGGERGAAAAKSGSSSSEAGAAGSFPSSRRSTTLWFRNGTVQSDESVVDVGDAGDAGGGGDTGDVNPLVLALHSDAASAEDARAPAGTQVGHRDSDRCGTSERAANGPAALLSTHPSTATAPLVQPQRDAALKLRASSHPAGVAFFCSPFPCFLRSRKECG
jgi:hypothetical protein